MKQALISLLKVKSLVTLSMTAALVTMLLIPSINPSKELLTLFCTSYGAVITYFFTRKKETENGDT